MGHAQLFFAGHCIKHTDFVVIGNSNIPGWVRPKRDIFHPISMRHGILHRPVAFRQARKAIAASAHQPVAIRAEFQSDIIALQEFGAVIKVGVIDLPELHIAVRQRDRQQLSTG